MKSQTVTTNDPNVAMKALARNDSEDDIAVNVTAQWNGVWNRVNTIAVHDEKYLAGWSNEHGHHWDFIDCNDTFAITLYTQEPAACQGPHS